jgi:predicted PurR-regulated permease PerM
MVAQRCVILSVRDGAAIRLTRGGTRVRTRLWRRPLEKRGLDFRLEQVTRIAAAALLVLGCLLVLQPFVTALLCAAIVCFSTWPMYECMARRLGGRRALAALAMTFLLLCVMVLPLAVLALTLADTAAPAIDWLRDTFAHGLPLPPDWVRDLPLAGEALDTGWRELTANKAKFAEAVKKIAPPVQQGLLKAGLLLGEGVIQLSLAAFVAFFLYRDGEALIAAARAAMKRLAGELAPDLLVTVGGTVQGVVYGLVGTAFAQGIVALIGFLVAGVPGAMLLAFLTFTLSMVPIGPPLIWGGAAAWLLYQDQTGWAIFMAAYGFIVISGIDNVIKPMLISRGSSLPFALVFLGVMGGVVAFGFVGIFLGPTLLAVGLNVLSVWLKPGATPPAAQA